MKSKFKLGQEIFFLRDNEVCTGDITGIANVGGECRLSIDDTITDDAKVEYTFDVWASQAYPTKEALLKSL